MRPYFERMPAFGKALKESRITRTLASRQGLEGVEAEIARLSSERREGATLATWLCREGVSYADLPGAKPLAAEEIREIELRVRYRGYVEGEEKNAATARRRENMLIPNDFN